MRWLLLDRICSIHRGKKAVTESRVPSAPYSREVLFIEMMAQTGGLLVGAESDYKNDVVFAKIEHATFSEVPVSGTPITIEACADGLAPEGGWIEGVITSAGGIVARSKFLLMSVGRLLPDRAGSVTFHENFMSYFNVREKVSAL
ncbi:MAG: (3R)-hydroxymyristoyl-ACP dehydratase [Candidatus Omnitrophica bacterium ADurb.Bin277]|nr:MAG: (3R)-hydroxymyristoyl-ACP dehydratase [Candidatus Omnitrophica bacterium ADurb.Bin277]